MRLSNENVQIAFIGLVNSTLNRLTKIDIEVYIKKKDKADPVIWFWFVTYNLYYTYLGR